MFQKVFKSTKSQTFMINDNMLEEEIRNVERRFLRANPKDIENEPSDSNSYAIRVCGNRLRVDR